MPDKPNKKLHDAIQRAKATKEKYKNMTKEQLLLELEALPAKVTCGLDQYGLQLNVEYKGKVYEYVADDWKTTLYLAINDHWKAIRQANP